MFDRLLLVVRRLQCVCLMAMRSLILRLLQRGNPEMEVVVREVIDRCCSLVNNNPISFIHDVGAGGLSTRIT